MLLVYSYCLGARRWRWMPFRPPILMAVERFIKNTSSHRIELIKQLFYRFIQNRAQALLPSPSQRDSLRWIGQIYTSHVVGAANSSPLWWCLLLSCAGGRWFFLYYSYRRKAMEQEFFVPAWTLIEVILIMYINVIDVTYTYIMLRTIKPTYLMGDCQNLSKWFRPDLDRSKPGLNLV